MNVLVCGGRAFNDRDLVEQSLYTLLRGVPKDEPLLVIHGACPTGVDAIADDWAERNGLQMVRCPANWKAWGPAAGPLRNRAMIELCPQLVVAFPGGKGTEGMVKLAEQFGIHVKRVPDQPSGEL